MVRKHQLERKENAAPIIEFLKKDQIIISQNGEMMICDEKNFLQ